MSHHPNDFPLLNAQGDAPERPTLAESPGQGFETEGGFEVLVRHESGKVVSSRYFAVRGRKV
jgi:hypothetical protein